MENCLHDIVEVVKLEHQNDVNKFLKHGWMLLETYTETLDPKHAPKHQFLYFVLGRPSNVPEGPKVTDYSDPAYYK